MFIVLDTGRLVDCEDAEIVFKDGGFLKTDMAVVNCSGIS